MAPKRRMPTRANPDSSDLPPMDPRESVGDSSAAPDVAHLARGMHQMQQSIDRLVDLFSRQPPPQPFVPTPEQPPVPAQSVPLVSSSQHATVSFAEFFGMHPPKFTGTDSSIDPQRFIEESHRICKALKCSPVRSVELVSYQLKDVAYGWFSEFSEEREDVPLLWPEFSQAFMRRFLPKSVRDAKAREFECLEQTDQMSVIEYDITFMRLSKFAPHLVSSEKLRVERFVNWLKGYLFRSIQIFDSTTYSDVLDQALRLEFRVKASQSRRDSAKRSRTVGAERSSNQRGADRARGEPVQRSVF